MKSFYQHFTKTLVVTASVLTLAACGELNSNTKNNGNSANVKATMTEVNQEIEDKNYTQAIENLQTMDKKDNKKLVEQLKLFQSAELNSKKASLKDLNKAVEEAEKAINMQGGSDVVVERANQLIKKINEVKLCLTDGNITLKKAQELYDLGKYDAANGMLKVFLEKDLSHPALATIKKDVTTLSSKIEAVLAQETKKAQTNDKKEYINERNSEVLAAEYLQETGGDIKEATDEELGAWLAEKEAQAEKKTEANVLAKVVAKAKIDMKDKQAFITKENDDLYQIEIRQSKKNSKEDVEVSNMIGLYQYVPSTGNVTKQNYLTGEFEPVDQPRAN